MVPMSLLISEDILHRVQALDIPFNRYGVDPYGARIKDIARMHTILRWLYKHYFTVSTSGIEHIPPKGRAMLVGNHAGGIALDALIVIASAFQEMEPPRHVQTMAEKFLNRLPFSSLFTSRTGQLTGLPEHAHRMLEDDRLLLVFPEGARGTAKLYGDRNRLIRFGTGFVRLALATSTPIIPFAFLGGGEAFPTIANLYKLGRLIGVPYIPITRYLAPVPRRTSMQIYYGAPILFTGSGHEEDAHIHQHVETVKQAIRDLLEQGCRSRIAMQNAKSPP